MRSHRAIALITASLTLVVGGTAPLFSQTYHMVSSRGIDPGQLRVWEVSAEGQMEVVQLIETGRVEYFHTFHIDPFGRFIIYPNSFEGRWVYEIYGTDGNGELTHKDTYDPQGWDLADNDHTLTPDGRLMISITAAQNPSPDEFHFIGLEITSDLQIVETGFRDPVPEQFLEIGITRIGSAVLPDGKYLLLTTGRQSTGYVSVLPVTASGEVGGLTQQFAYPMVQPIARGFATRLDQRVVVTGPMGADQLTSYEISPEGRLTPIDTYNLDEFGGLGLQRITFHPSGMSILSGGLPESTPIARTGEFPGPASIGPGSTSGRMAVSPDGRIGVAEWNWDSMGVHWGVFRLDPYGGIEMIADHVFPFGYTDIAFIPPRTEEVLGDANGDAMRDAADIVTYLNHLNDPGTYPEWHPLSPRIRGPVPEARADADQDGDIDVDDLAWLLDFLLDPM